MKKYFLSLLLFIWVLSAYSQKQKLYNPQADAKLQLSQAIAIADSLGKHVFVQIGGNWCPWCLRFNKFCKDNAAIDTLLRNNYVLVHLNYSPENKNLEVLKTLDNPQRFGFPVIVILDGSGKRIHTQDSALLEKEGSYDADKVISFMKYWTKAAVNYTEKEK